MYFNQNLIKNVKEKKKNAKKNSKQLTISETTVRLKEREKRTESAIHD
jgi:hypothetical protein